MRGFLLWKTWDMRGSAHRPINVKKDAVAVSFSAQADWTVVHDEKAALSQADQSKKGDDKMYIAPPSVNLPDIVLPANNVKSTGKSLSENDLLTRSEKERFLVEMLNYIDKGEKISVLNAQDVVEEGAFNPGENERLALEQSRCEVLRVMIDMAQKGSPDAVHFIVQLKIFSEEPIYSADYEISEYIDDAIESLLVSRPDLVAEMAKSAALIAMSPSESNVSGSVKSTLSADTENPVRRYQFELKLPPGKALDALFARVLFRPENTLKAATLWKNAAERATNLTSQGTPERIVKELEEDEAAEAVRVAAAVSVPTAQAFHTPLLDLLPPAQIRFSQPAGETEYSTGTEGLSSPFDDTETTESFQKRLYSPQ